MEKQKYPIRADGYQLYELVGQGVSAVVHRALCIPLDEIVAIKILDLERVNCDLNNITREAQTMVLINHPNVLNCHCSFMNNHELWVVMPYMSGGSCLHIMKSAYPDGFEEQIIATLLRDVLRGLEYLHRHGHIHRDVKAGNILVDSRGGVKLGDFGVSACLFDSGDRQRTRNTFVGTPCWMAPEVMEQLHGYDFKADIWSFGITALELAHGHAPFSKYPPMKVLLMTLQNAPPGLDYERDKKFSRSFKQMIAACLMKDPSKRPGASKLLKHSFFKQARSSDYIMRRILDELPTLGDRHQALKDKEEQMLAQKKMQDSQMEEISQNEYKRGISGWNFDLDFLKAQIPDDEPATCKDSESCTTSLFELETPQAKTSESITYSRSCSSNGDIDDDNDVTVESKPCMLSPPDQTICCQSSGRDGSDTEHCTTCTNDSSQNGLHFRSNDSETHSEGFESEIDEKRIERIPSRAFHERRASTSSCSSDVFPINKAESGKQQILLQNLGSFNRVSDALTEKIPRPSKATASCTDECEDKSKAPVVQQRGRFKVTSENIESDKTPPPLGLPKSYSLQVMSPLSTASLPSPSEASVTVLGGSCFPHLLSILQSNITQRDNILSLMKQLSCGVESVNRQTEGVSLLPPSSTTERSLLELAHDKEKELIQEITELQWRLICTQEELQRLKSRNAQV